MQSVFGILLLSISAHSLSYAEKMERFIRKYLDAIARTGIAIGAELYYCLTAGFALYLLNVDPTKISELA
ncbi:MAG TPA: hypothetical protein PK765_03890 [bacterium]|nr:hypothetical protein [bacterium]